MARTKRTEEVVPIDRDDDLDLYRLLAKQAATQAAIEIVTWSPIVKGDNICGRVVDHGTMVLPSLRNPGEEDVWPTNTLEPLNDVVMDGQKIVTTDKVLRVAWLGPVLLRQYQMTTPDFDDVVAMHYQSDQTPKTKGFNDYRVINAIVMDPETQQVKKPNLEIARFGNAINVNTTTGEMSGVEPGRSPLKQFEHLPPFPDEE